MNYYEILQVDSEADSKEIKKAFAKLVRKFPPESNPEEYNKIREAYEVLSNPDKKAEYDAKSKYNEEINGLLDSAGIALDEEKYDEAIRYYKKILILAPNLNYVKNYMALAYGYKGDYDTSIEILSELLEKDSECAHYHNNIAYAYAYKHELDTAEYHWKEAIRLDPTYQSAVSMLVKIYLEDNKYEEAVAFLKERATSVEELFYFSELLKLYSKKNQLDSIKLTVDEIFKLVPEDDLEERDRIAFEVGKVAYDLKGPFTLKGSIAILEKLIEIFPDDKEAADLLKSRKDRVELSDVYMRFCMDERYEDTFVRYIYMNVNCYDFSDEEYKKIIDGVLDNINGICRSKPSSLLSMLNNLKRDYPELYKLQDEYFQNLYVRAFRWESRNKNINKLDKDFRIPASIKKLVHLWMEDNISQEDRDKRFEEVRAMIKKSNCRRLVRGLLIFKKRYDEYYTLNSKYIDELIELNKEEAKKTPISNVIYVTVAIIYILYRVFIYFNK